MVEETEMRVRHPPALRDERLLDAARRPQLHRAGVDREALGVRVAFRPPLQDRDLDPRET
ncbi:hypothetical protein GCM10011574_63980 [Microbispora bryophytorum]|uniref:Uncharacterized protein n=1 Tax=Microbispora bryophytorum TaxID=1460882 RepID=A0A8H9H8S5_9ACTN|nr:hypothetical protein GCM10011574_63980 [Microbispora bryophytorum]